MNDLPFFFAAAVLVAAALASIALWAPRRAMVKLGALALAAAFLPVSYAAFADLLSRPKPVALEWWQKRADEATVLGSHLREGHGVYLWLQVAGTAEPRSYRLPWDRQAAQELVEALREAEKNGSGVVMRAPFEPSLDRRERRFYAMPQPALPEKGGDDRPGPQLYARPGQDT